MALSRRRKLLIISACLIALVTTLLFVRRYDQRTRARDWFVSHGGNVHYRLELPDDLNVLDVPVVSTLFGKAQVSLHVDESCDPDAFATQLLNAGHVDCLAISGTAISDRWFQRALQHASVSIIIIENSKISPTTIAEFAQKCERLEIV